MERAILIDGNNLMFRSYYATAYSGSILKNSKGFPTNALFGFVSMINKILKEENPTYILVAFDKGKNFRHELYHEYKAGRNETPNELISQFPVVKDILKEMGIKWLDCDNYEADDIIGSFARMADEDKSYDATIISSDKDLLQLISNDVDVKLLKQKDFVLMNNKTFNEEYGFEPIRIIDLKALMGDSSDNIPGVKGVGEKTALNLIREYNTLENVYQNIDNIKGKLHEKLVNDKEVAFFSKELCTIYKDLELNISFKDIKREKENTPGLHKIYEELEFYSLVKNKAIVENNDLNIIRVHDKLNITKPYSLYLELSEENYHFASIIGCSIYDGTTSYYFDEEALKLNIDVISSPTVTYDKKKVNVVFNRLGSKSFVCPFDTLIAGYLLNYNIKDDIAYLSSIEGYDIVFIESIVGKNAQDEKEIIKNICLKSKFLYETKDKYIKELENEELKDLFDNIEMPLVDVLTDMEITGINVDKNILKDYEETIKIKLDIISNDIYNQAGEKFNISSPKQLGEILYEKLNLPHGKKKGRNGYKCDHDTLVKLSHLNPIIGKILEHRNLSKLLSTYLSSLTLFIMDDNKIHTIYKQTITRTGRLSSIYPNLQNIPVRSEEGREIRKAFIPSKDSVILTSDYSQIELRVLAHISECKELIDGFNNNEDIHTKVAADIYGIPKEAVSKTQRRTAKAVIFGIVYGISGFGLGENLDLSYIEAREFIDKYLTLYPGVKTYMDNIIIDAHNKGYVRTIMNRKRVIDELNNPNYMIRQSGERIALNTPIQGSSADIIKKAMIEMLKIFKEKNLKSKMILQVHDELVFDVKKEELKEVEKIVRDVMENTYKLLVPLKVEIDYGNDWYEAK